MVWNASNDMFLTPKLCYLKMFADISTIHTHGDSIEELNFKLSNDVKSINDWCNQNRMCINLAKTKGMVISTSQKLRHQPFKHLSVKIGEDCIENVNSQKILGIVVDYSLNWSIQVENIAKKVNIGIVALRRIDKLTLISYRQVFANSFIIPHLDYCSTVWGARTKILCQ